MSFSLLFLLETTDVFILSHLPPLCVVGLLSLKRQVLRDQSVCIQAAGGRRWEKVGEAVEAD